MSIDLVSTSTERKSNFYSLRTFADLANVLEVKPGYLNYVLYKIPRNNRYTKFEIPKKTEGKVRVISNPIPPLKIIQRKLLQILEEIYEPRCSAYGFIKKKNIVKNAKAHKKKTKLKYVFNVDIENFFPSIHFGRVRGLFQKPPYNLPRNVATWLAQICCYEEGLPQGAPTSPIIANMICNKMDSQMQRLAQRHRCTYTRYADDITFSTSMPRFPTGIAQMKMGQVNIGDELSDILFKNKFKVNEAKLRLQPANRRQEITGLTVNRFPNVRRKYIRQIRAMLYDWGINGYEAAEKKHLANYRDKHRFPGKGNISFRSVVRGKIDFLKMVRGENDPIYIRFMRELSRLDETVTFEENYVAEKPISIFLSYASENRDAVKEIYSRLKTAGYNPWMDTEDIIGGEDWDLAIQRAIDNADLVILMLTKLSLTKRGYLQKEMKKVLGRWEEKLADDIFIIPLRLEECDVKDPRLSKIQRIDFFANNGWNRLNQSIQESIRRATE